MEPPVTASAESLKLPVNSVLTLAPDGAAVSSATPARVALPEPTGASLTELTVMLKLPLMEPVAACA